MKKNEYWERTFDDSIQILRILPRLASLIYREKYGKTESPMNN